MSKPAKKKGSRKLAFRIAVIYLFFMIINVIFFSVMIFENQTDLLHNSFRYHSDNLVKTVQTDLKNEQIKITPDSPEKLEENLDRILNSYDYRAYYVIDDQANILFKKSQQQDAEASLSKAGLLERLQEFRSRDLVFQTSFSTRLNEDDFSVDLLMPLNQDNTYFLSVVLDMKNMQQRLQSLYNQIAIAILWGVIFHVIFAVFVYRVIFRRIFSLKEASRKLADGNLQTRIAWNMKRNDELDELGQSFNSMAETIDQKVTTITTQLNTIEQLNSEIQNELSIGKEVQESLSSDLNLFSELNPELLWKPLRQVSGDLCNLYRAKDGSVLILMVDAAGHGVSAALINTLTLVAFEEAIETHATPGKILQYMNDSLARRLQSYLYATCILVRIATEEMQWVSAGHVSCLFNRNSMDETVELTSTGPPLGIIEHMEYEEKSIRTKPGDRILLFTDGIPELENSEKEPFGIGRLVQYLRKDAALSTKQLVSKIDEETSAYTEHVTDDITLLCVEIPD